MTECPLPRVADTCYLAGERLPEPGRVDPPEVVLLTVDEGDRDLLAVQPEQLRVAGDVDLGPADAELLADRVDDLRGVLAQMAAGLGVHGDPRRAHRPASRNRPLATFPVTECGSWSTTAISAGHLNLASRDAAYDRTAATSIVSPGRGTTKALTASPVSSFRMPITATSRTPGAAIRTSSTSTGKTLNPDTMISSRLRSTR